VLGLAVTALLGWALYAGWTGFALGPVAWPGAAAVIGDTWLWDLRWPLLPAYVATMLWVAERAAGRLAARAVARG
jgi:hypothetical protein